MTDSQLMELSHLDTMLARATRIDEITEIRARAEAMRIYAVNIKASREQCNEYAIARIRSERKAGKVLSTLNFHGNNQHKRISSNSMSLKDYGITSDESYRWRAIANMPDELFNKIMKERYDSQNDITTDFFFKAARIHTMRQRGINTDRPHTPAQTITISITDMAQAAATIRDKLSAEQVTQLIAELRK